MKSIKTKILGITSFILLISLSLVTAVFGVMSIGSTEYTLETVLKETAKVSATAIQTQIDLAKNNVLQLGMNPSLWDEASAGAKRAMTLKSAREDYGYQQLSMTDLSGKTSDGKDVSGEEFYIRAARGETFMSSPMVNEDATASSILISAPVWREGRQGSQVVGVIYALLDGIYLSELTNTVEIGKTGYIYLIDGKGVTIADIEYENVLALENSTEDALYDKELKAMADLEQAAIHGEFSFGVVSYGGEKQFLMVSPVAGTDQWALGILLEYGEFMARPLQALFFCIVISLVSMVGAILLVIRFATKITKPVTEMKDAVDRVAKGDYDVDIVVETRDEIGIMAVSMRNMIQTNREIIGDAVRVLNEMAGGNFKIETAAEFTGIFQDIEIYIKKLVESLSDTLGQIQVSSTQVAGGADQVSQGAQVLSEGTTDQAAAVEELSAVIDQAAEHAKRTLENSGKANRLADDAGHEVESSMQSMEHMKEAMNDISLRSNEIVNIIKSIDDIAFRTNILALNAAVEAARAGEAGKGFSVVADEVRGLAQRSAKAAQSTAALIEDTLRSVGKGVEITEETAGRLTSVVERFTDLHENINTIAQASEMQTAALSQITDGIGQISAVVQMNSATSQESAAASEELSSQAQLLNSLVSRFQL